jgi:hypothetical protein
MAQRGAVNGLIGQEFSSRSAFVAALAQHLDGEELRQFQPLLLSISSRGMRSLCDSKRGA